MDHVAKVMLKQRSRQCIFALAVQSDPEHETESQGAKLINLALQDNLILTSGCDGGK